MGHPDPAVTTECRQMLVPMAVVHFDCALRVSLAFTTPLKESPSNVLDPTYERKTKMENHFGLNLWLLVNNRRDAAYVHRSQGRVENTNLLIFLKGLFIMASCPKSFI
jgi:hypothetical protein